MGGKKYRHDHVDRYIADLVIELGVPCIDRFVKCNSKEYYLFISQQNVKISNILLLILRISLSNYSIIKIV